MPISLHGIRLGELISTWFNFQFYGIQLCGYVATCMRQQRTDLDGNGIIHSDTQCVHDKACNSRHRNESSTAGVHQTEIFIKLTIAAKIPRKRKITRKAMFELMLSCHKLSAMGSMCLEVCTCLEPELRREH